MAHLIEVNGQRPTIGADVWLAPTATLAGDVRIDDRASVWFGAVLRADFAPITIGEETSVQDNVVIHTAEGLPTEIDARVTVGHGALLEGCVVERQAVIGMGAIVLQRARVGEQALVAAGAVVREGQHIGAHELAVGVPAQTRPGSEGARRWAATSADQYQGLRESYAETGAMVEDHGATNEVRSV